jgi:signal peptidase
MRPRQPRPARRRLVGALTWLVVAALLAAWAVYLRPATMGGPTGYVIVSGQSMEPMMRTGDLALVHRQDDYAVGDVVAYRIPKDDVGAGFIVIHRVIGGSADEGLVLQGDNRDTPDIWLPRRSDVVGTLRWHVPRAGTVLFLLRTPMVIGGVLGFLGFWFVATSGGRKTEEEQPPAEPALQPAPVAVVADPMPPPRVGRATQRTGDVAVATVVAFAVAGLLISRRASD